MTSAHGLFTTSSITPPPIHYIWIGPPKGTGISGHDVAGPLTMAKQNSTNPIYFWCLEEHRDSYQDKFRDYHNVRVNTVEELLAQAKEIPMLEPFVPPIVAMLNRINRNKESKDLIQNPIRDFVTLKDAISLLLQSIKGRKGYVFDTNILPYEDKPLSLPAYEKYRAPHIAYPAIPGRRPKQESMDCWAMYCPAKSATGLKMLASFLEKVAVAEKEKELKAPAKQKKGMVSQEQKYHDNLGAAIIGTLMEQKQHGGLEGWATKLLVEEAGVIINEPGFPLFLKAYFNSHKLNRPAQHAPDLYGQVSVDNLPWLRFMLNQGEPIDQQLEKTSGDAYFKGETLLHMAIKCDSIHCARLLLERGANPDLIADYEGHQMTARMMIEERPDDFRELLPLLKKPPTPSSTPTP